MLFPFIIRRALATTVAGLAFGSLVGLGGVLVVLASSPALTAERPDISFAPVEDKTIRDPDNPAKVFRVDFAKVEAEFPLSRAELMRLTPDNLEELSQEEIDQIYGRLTAGPIPDGAHQGTLFFARGDSLRQRLDEVLGGVPGRIAGRKLDLLERIGGSLWKGKMFDRDEGTLRNFIEDLAVLELIIDEPDTVPTAIVPRGGGLLGALVPNTEVWMLFPAKVYCGQSLVDGRRESIVVDYAFADEIEGYRPSPDGLAGRKGLDIRDEIRMIRPGFYLGRAYMNRAFLLNFTLYDPQVAEGEAEAFTDGAALVEDCWTGEQVRRAAAQ